MNVPERVLTEELPLGWWMLTVTRKNPGKFRQILRLDSGPEGSVKVVFTDGMTVDVWRGQCMQVWEHLGDR